METQTTTKMSYNISNTDTASTSKFFNEVGVNKDLTFTGAEYVDEPTYKAIDFNYEKDGKTVRDRIFEVTQINENWNTTLEKEQGKVAKRISHHLQAILPGQAFNHAASSFKELADLVVADSNVAKGNSKVNAKLLYNKGKRFLGFPKNGGYFIEPANTPEANSRIKPTAWEMKNMWTPAEIPATDEAASTEGKSYV